jgi:hypothetical protein
MHWSSHFTKGVFAEKVREIGIQQEYSLLYEHEQAGVAENTNRVIIDKARTMMNSSGLDMKFWPDAVCTAFLWQIDLGIMVAKGSHMTNSLAAQ